MGAIFENMAVSSFVKKNLNAGRRSNLFFYRENRGIEVDMVEQNSHDSIHLYEIKAGKTLQPDYSVNMKKLASQMDISVESSVIYNGESIPPLAINIRDI